MVRIALLIRGGLNESAVNLKLEEQASSMTTEKDLNVFARLRLAPFLKEAVQAAVVERPQDTIDFVIHFLTKNKDNLQRGMITEAINYMHAGGKLENGADEMILKQYETVKVRSLSALRMCTRCA